MHGRMDDEARRIDRVIGAAQNVALLVHLDQRRGGDFLEEHAVGVEQEMVVRVRNARRDMGAGHVAPPVLGGKLVAGREIDPHLPFVLGHAVGDGAQSFLPGGSGCHVGSSMSSFVPFTIDVRQSR